MLTTTELPSRKAKSPFPFSDTTEVVELSEKMAQIGAMQQRLTRTVQQQQVLVMENQRRVSRDRV